MSYSNNQVKNPNGKLTVQISKVDIYNSTQQYENIIVKLQIGTQIKVTPPCPFGSKMITWADNFDVLRKQNEDNLVISVVNLTKKVEEVLGTASIEINQFLQRARKMDFQADLQLNGKNTCSAELKIQFTKLTDAEILALDVQKSAADGKKGDDSAQKKLENGLMNEASKKLRENELQTNYNNNTNAQKCKYLLTITNIKGTFNRDTDLFKKMDPFVRIRVSEEINFKTSVKKAGGTTCEWNEELQIPVGLEELIIFQALDQDLSQDELIGSGSLLSSNLRVGNEIRNITLVYEKMKVGELILTLNCKVQNDFEKQSGLKGKIAIRNISTNLKSGFSNHQLKFTYFTENRCTAIIHKSEAITNYSEDIITLPIKDKLQTALQVSLQSMSKKGEEVHGASVFDMKPIIEKEKWYIQEQIQIIGKDKKEIGKLIADIQYIDFAEHEDEKLFKLQQNEGKVIIRNMRAYLTRDTDTFGKMDPYCIVTYNSVVQKTSVHKSGGKEPIWKDKVFELPQFSYQKDRILNLDVFEEDPGQDDEVGRGQVDLTPFLQKKGNYLGQKVEIFFQGKSAGQINFDLESVDNKDLVAYLEKKKKEKELEELQQKKLEEELKAQKAKEEAERKKKEEEERKKKEEEDKKKKQQEEEELKKKKQQEEEEKKKKEELEKKKKEEEDKKKKDEEERLKKENEEKKKKEEADKKAKEDLEKKKKEDDDKLKKDKDDKSKKEDDDKKKKEEEDRKRKEDEEKKKKEEEDKKKREEEERRRKDEEDEKKKKELAQQKEMELKRQNEEREKAQKLNHDHDHEHNSQDHQHEDHQNSNNGNTESLHSPSKNYSDYKVAKQNLEQGHGFGMSEFQSATSLQKSTYAYTIPRTRRFKPASPLREGSQSRNGPEFVQLPSIFEQNAKKGTSFGVGQRSALGSSNSPGPGAYTQDSQTKSKGYTFGVSRSNCKNMIVPTFGSPSTKVNQSFESPQKQDRHSSFDHRTLESPNQYHQKQNNAYLQQNKYLQQQQQQQYNNQKRNGSLEYNRNSNNNAQAYLNNNLIQHQNHPRRQIYQKQHGSDQKQNPNNNSYVVYSNPKHTNYHYTVPAQRNNQSFHN